MIKLIFIPMMFAFNIGMGQASNSASIIGKPIKIGKLLVAQYDFPSEMDWFKAKKACAALGIGWRLPTLDETSILWDKRFIIGGFALGEYDYYWSSTEVNFKTYEPDHSEAFMRKFQMGSDFYDVKSSTRKVRAVKTVY